MSAVRKRVRSRGLPVKIVLAKSRMGAEGEGEMRRFVDHPKKIAYFESIGSGRLKVPPLIGMLLKRTTSVKFGNRGSLTQDSKTGRPTLRNVFHGTPGEAHST